MQCGNMSAALEKACGLSTLAARQSMRDMTLISNACLVAAGPYNDMHIQPAFSIRTS
jgi:hypothetical protein